MDMILADGWELEDRGSVIYTNLEDLVNRNRDQQSRSSAFRMMKPNTILVTGGRDLGIYKDRLQVSGSRMLIAGTPSEWEEPVEVDVYVIGLNNHAYQGIRKISDKITKWYSSNMGVHDHPFEGIPFGTNPSTKELVVKYKDTLKDKLLYMNFRHEREDGYELCSEIAHDFRIEIWNRYKDRDWVTVESKVSEDQYCSNLAQHKFAFSPAGNGVDTYRTWECLYLGVIPIVQKSEVTAWFSDLPILELTEDEWKNLDDEFLERKYGEMKSKTYNMEKLDKRFWINRIEDEVYD
jgi:hypothetical protein